MDPNATQMLDLNRTQSLPGLNVTQTIQPVQCPICKTFNPAGEAFCVECGLLFSSALPDDAFGAPAVRLPCFVDESGREHFLRPGSNIVGREGDILLTDSRISRKHAEVTLTNGAVSVKDLGSTNGTFIDDRNLEADEVAELKEGDTVRFGGVTMTLSIPGDSGATKMVAPMVEEAEDAAEEAASEFVLLIGEDANALKVGENKVGRRPDNDIVISDAYASGSHAVIECHGGEVFFTDIGSTNGTFLNGAKLSANQRVTLTPDDELTIGTTTLRVQRAN